MLILLACVAAVVTGAMGYGFSSIVMPVALLFVASRLLNPALVLIEVALNAYALVIHRRHIGAAWPTVRPLIAGVPIGVVAGSLWLSRVDAVTAKLVVYGFLLTILCVQAAGFSSRLRIDRLAGPVIGSGLGLLHALTTIAGPPLAVLLSNQGLAAREFRAGMAVVRLAEGVVTILAYRSVGLMDRGSVWLLAWMLPGVALGLPLGVWASRRVDAAVYRMVSMTFTAWVVAYGLAVALGARGMSRLSVAPFLAALAVTWSIRTSSRSQALATDCASVRRS
jgi:hypothetical protein